MADSAASSCINFNAGPAAMLVPVLKSMPRDYTQKFLELIGHKSVSGHRASINYAATNATAGALVDYLETFARENL